MLPKSTKVFLLAALIGIPAAWNFNAHAAQQSPAPVLLDDDEKFEKYIKPLREDRQKLEDVKADLKAEAYAPHGNRHEAMDSIDKAIKHISDEIEEYKKDNNIK